MTKIYDCFLFLNELELLEIRLNILYPHVDFFVINESTTTFSGNKKPLYFQENKHRFEKFSDKIIYNIVDIPNNLVSSWDRETFHRNSIIERIDGHAKPEDIIITSDLDEIPNPDIIKNLNNFFDSNKLYHCKQKFYYYYLNNCLNRDWYGSRICSFAFLKRNTVQAIRQATEDVSKLNGIVLENAGWHFSYLGGAENIRFKIESFSHQEFNNSFVKNKILENLKNNRDIFDRDIHFKPVSIDDSFPTFIVNNQYKYEHLIINS